MKTIEYKNKETKATTQYREIQPADKRWVLDKLRDIEGMRAYCENTRDEELRKILINLNKPTSKIPKLGTGGYNSIVSAVGGILSNIEDGTQRDFSNKTCAVIEKTFAHLNSFLPEWELIQFIEVTEFSVQKVTPPKPIISSPDQKFSVVLGDYEIDVVIKKK